MHWIKCTAPNGKPIYLRLDAFQHMEQSPDGNTTFLYSGQFAMRKVPQLNPDGTTAGVVEAPIHGTCGVKETPEEIFKKKPIAIARLGPAPALPFGPLKQVGKAKEPEESNAE